MSDKRHEKVVPDHQQRIKAIRDVVYEYANLMAAAHYSMNGQPPWRTNCTDAFLLGCRKLRDFLLNETRARRDDVLALDYLTNTTLNWKLPIWTAEWRKPMNKQLAHISYSRNKEWDHEMWVPKLELEFNRAWWDFREAITDRDYSDEFDVQLLDRRKEEYGFGNIALQRHKS